MLFIKVYISQLHQYSGIYSESISRALCKNRHTALTLEKLESKQMALSPVPPPPPLTFALFSRRMENTDEIVRENTTIAFVMFALLFSSAAF